MIIKINPNSLTSKDRALLLALFQQAPNDCYGWSSEKNYDVNYKKIILQVTLSSYVIKRPSKKAGDNNYRYDVIDSDAIGSGSFGTVYPVITTYRITRDDHDRDTLSAKDKPKGHRRIVKVTSDLASAKKEVRMAQKTSHLSPKEPVVFQNFIFTVSRLIEGQPLFDIINDDLDGKKILPLHVRFQLSIKLLEELDQQILRNGLIHRDIKAENIIADKYDMTVGYIDLGLAREVNDTQASSSVGSLCYISPEALLGKKADHRSDTYSIGRTLSLLWRMDARLFMAPERLLGQQTHKPQDREQDARLAVQAIQLALDLAKANDYSSLFRGLTLHNDAKRIIRQTIKQLTAYNKEDRPSLIGAIIEFEKARDAHYCPLMEPEIAKTPTSSKTSTTSPQTKKSTLFDKKKSAFQDTHDNASKKPLIPDGSVG